MIEKTWHSVPKAETNEDYLYLLVDELLCEVFRDKETYKEAHENKLIESHPIERALRALAHARNNRKKSCLTCSIADLMRHRGLIQKD